MSVVTAAMAATNAAVSLVALSPFAPNVVDGGDGRREEEEWQHRCEPRDAIFELYERANTHNVHHEL